MSPEKRSERYYSLEVPTSADPFNIDNLFFGALRSMGFPVRVDSAKGKVVIRDREAWDQAFQLRDQLYTNSIWHIFGSVEHGGSNEMELLLVAPDHIFYERYPQIERKHPIRKAVVEKLFMRAYLQWQAYLERDPIAKHSSYPTEEERTLYRKLHKKGVRAISASQMQTMFKEAIERE